VQFKSGHFDSQPPVIATWEQIEKLYKCNKHGVIHILYKLTDTHSSPVNPLCYESELGCSSHGPHSSSRIYAWCLQVRNSVFIHSVVVRNNVTSSIVTCFLVGKLFFKLANCDNETSVELLTFLCFL
jgi:hypothetical protein